MNFANIIGLIYSNVQAMQLLIKEEMNRKVHLVIRIQNCIHVHEGSLRPPTSFAHNKITTGFSFSCFLLIHNSYITLSFCHKTTKVGIFGIVLRAISFDICSCWCIICISICNFWGVLFMTLRVVKEILSCNLILADIWPRREEISHLCGGEN